MANDEEEFEEEPSDGEEEYSPAVRERISQLNKEAKKHRLRVKELTRQLREKEGSGKDTDAAIAHAEQERDALRVENFCLRQATIHGVDPDLLEVKLRRAGHLSDPEDLDPEMAEMVAREMKNAAGKEKPPRSPKLSGKRQSPASDDVGDLARRFPALTRRQ